MARLTHRSGFLLLAFSVPLCPPREERDVSGGMLHPSVFTPVFSAPPPPPACRFKERSVTLSDSGHFVGSVKGFRAGTWRRATFLRCISTDTKPLHAIDRWISAWRNCTLFWKYAVFSTVDVSFE